MQLIIDIIFSTQFAFSVLRLMTPILLIALAALVAARSGITNMALEGITLTASLFGVIGSAYAQNAWVGLLCAIIVAVIMSLSLAFFKIKMKTDEILAAIALNMLASGGTVFLLYLITGDRSTSSALPSISLPIIHIPFLKDIPVLGPILSGHNIVVYISLLAVVVVHYVLFKTALGLRIRAVGGNPGAATSVGVSVEKTQYIAFIICGILAGLAGAYMSMGYMNVFTKDMTAGRGYIGLAASSVGGQSPIGAFFASLLFGVFSALGNNLQVTPIPAEIIYLIPYATTIIAYAYASYRKLTKRQRAMHAAARKVAKEA